jgi:hypothetical protein
MVISTVWVGLAANLLGIDVDYLRDPIASNLSVSNTPRPGIIAYSPVADSGSPNCDNTPINPCTHYKITATLSNGQQYTVSDP